MGKVLLLILALTGFAVLPSHLAAAHSGRTDSSGGHNCNVGSCAGTYHYHNGGSVAPSQPSTVQPFVAPSPVITTTEETTEVVVPFQTSKQDSQDLEIGTTAVSQDGVDGLTLVTYEVVLTDGQETSRTEIAREVVNEPIPEVTLVGTKVETITTEAPIEVAPVAEVLAATDTADDEEVSDVYGFIGLGVIGALAYGGYRGFKTVASKL